MSKDIRSFFSTISKKNQTATVKEAPKKTKRLIDSDDECVIESTPEKPKVKSHGSKRKVVVLSSDSEDEVTVLKSSEQKNLRAVDIGDVFSDKPIKQSKIKDVPKGEIVKREDKIPSKTKRKKVKSEDVLHDDRKFQQTLLELDDDFLLTNLDVLDKTAEDALNVETNTETPKTKNEKIKEKHNSNTKKHDTENVKSHSTKDKKRNTELDVHNDADFEQTLTDLDADSKIDDNSDILIEDVGCKQSSSKENSSNKPKREKKAKRQRSPSEGSSSKKNKLEHTDSGIDPDQEVFEKRRYSAMLYQKYKNRGGPKMQGQKEYPQGNPQSLNAITFLRTGVLDSLDGDEFQNIVKEHGGRVVYGVSKKVNYLVVGEDAGPSKLSKARNLNIPEINEDQFLDMILVKSGMKPKYFTENSLQSCDSGVFDDTTTKKPKNEENHKKEKKHKEENLEKMKNKDYSEKKQDKQTAYNKKMESPIKKKREEKTSEKTKPKLDSKEISPKKEKPQTSKYWSDDKSTSSVISVSSSSSIDTSETPKVRDSSLAWTEKYKPVNVKSIIGQQLESSNMNKLKRWLSNWYRNQLPEVRKKLSRPSPWASNNDDGSYFKAALLSGPPGVGKTTTASLVSEDLGFDIVEFNASDTRSKKLLQEQVSQLLTTKTIAGFAAGNSNIDKKRVLLMDEVDGMAGNEDRGGIQELINLIKATNVPIICMCNDRNHQKMRSLVNYCFDLRFTKPKLEQIKGAMMSICFKEGLKIPPNILTEIIAGTDCDIRQTLNHLTVWSADNDELTLEQVQRKAEESRKDTVLGPWEVVRKVFTESEQKKMSLPDKSKLFFYDYSLGPLFVQENYLNVTPSCKKSEVMKRVAMAADAISRGDLVDSKIRSSNNWSLLEIQAMYSSVLPGYYMSGNVTGRINFPGWLGKNSNANKRKRLLSELHVHTRMSTSGSVLALKLDYLLPLRNAIVKPLLDDGIDGIPRSIEVMDDYNLIREDLNNILELCQWKDTKNPFNSLEAKVKSAFTRAYNKQSHKLPFAPGVGFSKNRSRVNNTEGEENTPESDIDEEDETKDDITTDSLIKVKVGSEKKKESSKPGTSKGKDSSKGKKESSKSSTSRAKGKAKKPK